MSGPPTRLLIGLVGPMGCGKSTVGRMLGDLGAMVIDADAVAREMTAPGTPALSHIRARFGDQVFAPDGALDRSALAEIVFSDDGALRDLEAIVHPRVREAIDGRLAAASDSAEDGPPIVAIEAIKLVEGGLAERCHEVWLIECGPSTQRLRLAGRGIAAADLERRLASQGVELVARLEASLAGRVHSRRLSTEGTLDDVRERVEDALADALLRSA
jgi:dephospho-CoA kinase